MIELLPNVIEIKSSQLSRLSLSNSSIERALNLKESIDTSQQKNDEINVLNIVDGQLENLSTNSIIENQKKLVEKWNKKTTCIIDEQRVVIDRSSWITKNGKQIKYASDTIGYPMLVYFIIFYYSFRN